MSHIEPPVISSRRNIRCEGALHLTNNQDSNGTPSQGTSTLWPVDEIVQGACWAYKEWVFTMANLLGGCAAPLARWIRTGLSVGQPIDQEVVVHHLLEAYGDGQTLYAAYEKLEQCRQ